MRITDGQTGKEVQVRFFRTSREAHGVQFEAPQDRGIPWRLVGFYAGWIGGLIGFCLMAEWLRGL